MSDDSFGTIFGGFILGAILGVLAGVALVVETDTHIKGAAKAIELCERNIPRNQECIAVITAEVKHD